MAHNDRFKLTLTITEENVVTERATFQKDVIGNLPKTGVIFSLDLADLPSLQVISGRDGQFVLQEFRVKSRAQFDKIIAQLRGAGWSAV